VQEQSKASARRANDWRFANRWFVGRGIDIGCGDDPINPSDWPFVSDIVPYDVIYGHSDATYLKEIEDTSFDFVHSSHCLEHLPNFRAAMANWLRVLKKGGFIICTVPEELLYECGRWPSMFNSGHRTSFTMRSTQILPKSINILHELWKLPVDVEHVTLLTEGWSREKFGKDQTLLGAECSIEFVAKKASESCPW